MGRHQRLPRSRYREAVLSKAGKGRRPLLAVIATAQNVNRWLAPNGWMIVDPSFSTPSIST
jgi:hypothetical protein